MFKFFALALLWVGELYSQPNFVSLPSDIDWMTLHSDHFQILYRKGSDSFAERALRNAERAYGMLHPIFPEAPPKTWILLTDSQDSTNGYALDFPYPHMVLFAAPPEASSQLSALDDWFYSLILHEYVHILHLYPAGGLWSVLRSLFGSWVVPNGMMPSHFHEGLAVFLETELTQGGRGRSPFFRMLRRMAVKEKLWGTSAFASLDRMESSNTLFPHGSTPYFFGYHLYKALWDKKGAQGIKDLTLSYSSNWPYFLNTPLKEVYATKYEDLWSDTFAKTQVETEKEIDEIAKQPLSELRYLTQTKYTKSDPTLSPDRKQLFYRSSHPEEGTYLNFIETQTGLPIKRIRWKGGLDPGACWVQFGGREELLLFEVVPDGHYSLRQISALDIARESSRPLRLEQIHQKPLDHVHVLSCDKNQLLVYQESGGVGFVRDVQVEEGRLRAIREWRVPEGLYVNALLASEPMIVSVREGMRSTLYQWPRGVEPKRLFSVSGHLQNFKQASKNSIFAIADLDGRDEIWEIFWEEAKVSKRVALLGGTNGFDVGGGKFFVSSFEHGGFDIAKASPLKLSTRPIRNETRTPQRSPATAMSGKGSYSPLQTLLPTAWVPSVFFVPDGVQFGVWIPGVDLSQRHLYNLFGGYDSRGLLFADFSYLYRFGKDSHIGLSSFFLPSYIVSTKDFFKRWGGGVTFGMPLVSIDWEMGPIIRRVESSRLGPANQSVGAYLSASKSFAIDTKPLAPAPTKGTRVTANISRFFKGLGSDDDYFSTTAAITQYLEAPWWDRHVWVASLRGGYVEGTSLYNSFFDGGGELLFSQSRGFFLNRGFIPGLFTARRIVNLNLEYRFPIGTVERGMGLLPIKLRTLSGAWVCDTTTFDLGPKQARDRVAFDKALFKVFFTSIGAELKSDWLFFYYLPTQIRLGLYHGFGEFGETIYATFGIEAGL